jgi:signal transduction histidine kinase
LGLALRNFAEGYTERSGITVGLDISPDMERLPPDTELILFRVVQEALTNVSRHSGSRTARIRLEHRSTAGGRDVVLTIEDRGKGMPHAGRLHGIAGLARARLSVQGVGLASMRERLHQIGGRLEIDSAVGHTTLKAVVPARERDAA